MESGSPVLPPSSGPAPQRAQASRLPGSDVQWQPTAINKELRSQALGQRPRIVWFTGLSGSGKSTLANLLEVELTRRGFHTMSLDGDNVRHGLNRDLGFTEADRVENIRRVGEVGRLMVEAGLIVLASFISPYVADRLLVRELFEPGEFIEVWVDAPLAECERRDPKGLYRRARAGVIPNFTGIGAPYEAPEHPEIRLQTDVCGPEACVAAIICWLETSP